MAQQSEPAAPGPPAMREQPFDNAANQSLSDALQASFGILKGIMAVLVVLYLFSNVRSIDSSEQALVLRLGRLLPGVHDPGLVWAFPFPIDEIVPLPTKQSNEIRITSQSFQRRGSEAGKPLAMINRSVTDGLDPSVDGALLTADAGLVHVKWKVTYKIDDVSSYVSNIVGDTVTAADQLIQTLVENVGIRVASELTAEEIIRTRVDYVRVEMRRRLNEKLAALRSGIYVTLVEMYEFTPPLAVRDAFDATQRAENAKQQTISDAKKAETKLLSEAAGTAHKKLIAVLDRIDRGPAQGETEKALHAELDRLLTHEVEGKAGRTIKRAGSLMSVIVGRMQSDLKLYRTLLLEYERTPSLLVGRLWEQARNHIFHQPGVRRIYRPANSEFRLQVSLDPQQERMVEELRLQEKEFDPSSLQKRILVPLGPDDE